MYYQHFGLNRSPFNIEPDPDFLWLGEKHQEGLAVLRYGILENKGFLLLTGDVGTGKTVLIKRLLTSLTEDVTVATIPDPRLTLLEFFNILSHELGMASAVDGKADFLIKFKKFVRHVYGSQKRLLVIIDEAQRLTSEMLEEIRVLSNIDYDNHKLVNIFFAGQIELNQILIEPCNRPLRQRISISYHLVPLSQEETDAYIRHRLKVAGTEKELFMPEAVQEIFKFSNGTPRLINLLCDRALITGYMSDLSRVGSELIRECARELDMLSDAETTDIKSAPQTETLPAIEETADQVKALIKPSETRRRWIPVAVVGALAFLLFGIFFMRTQEKNQTQVLPSTESQTIDIRQLISADPKDAFPAAITRLSDSPKSQKPIEPRGRRFLLFFKPSSVELEEDSYKILRQASDFLSTNPNSEITLTCHSTQDDRTSLAPKLLELRATSIRSVLTAKPEFKGKITVIDSFVKAAVEDPGLPGRRLSTPWTEIRVEPGAKSQGID